MGNCPQFCDVISLRVIRSDRQSGRDRGLLCDSQRNILHRDPLGVPHCACNRSHVNPRPDHGGCKTPPPAVNRCLIPTQPRGIKKSLFAMNAPVIGTIPLRLVRTNSGLLSDIISPARVRNRTTALSQKTKDSSLNPGPAITSWATLWR